MVKNNQPDRSIALNLALIPGLGHLILGRKRRGLHLLIFSLAMLGIMSWRWEVFKESIVASDIGTWIAPAFIIVALGGERDILRIGYTPASGAPVG